MVTATIPSPASSGSTCPECSGRLRPDAQRGEVVCARCGLVVEQRVIDPGPEWRAFTPEQHASRSRAGPAVSTAFPEGSLGAFVGFGSKDGQGRQLSPSARRHAARLRRWQTRSRLPTHTLRTIREADEELDRILDMLGLPRTLHEPALALFRKGHAQHVVRGRSVRGVAAASLVVAARQASLPLRLRDVARAVSLPAPVLARTVKALARAVHVGVAAPGATQFVERLGSDVGASPRAVTMALGMLAEPRVSASSVGRSPAIVAAAAVYLSQKALGEPASQARLARAAGSSEVALRSNIRAVREALAAGQASRN
jgi:transcription initiation factor TFIIB